ncbi:PREDICTED: factor of DNA methylation 1-like [Camelina sativa]|uniref:Factor of DNA methylation 1-like n=1 Tax=Camelina sativa TaxID=90675 RepID=A0ABM0VT06_CAMSA|nr:PREDICTED: factor of DNA methylation 1-like [Camelina sativa]
MEEQRRVSSGVASSSSQTSGEKDNCELRGGQVTEPSLSSIPVGEKASPSQFCSSAAAGSSGELYSMRRKPLKYKSKGDDEVPRKEQQLELIDNVTAPTPSGLLTGLKPGIINHVRTKRQVFSILESLIRNANDDATMGETHTNLNVKESIRQDSAFPFKLPFTGVSANANSITNLEQATSLAVEGRKQMDQKLLLIIERIIAEKKALEKKFTEMEKLDSILEANFFDEAENKLLLMMEAKEVLNKFSQFEKHLETKQVLEMKNLDLVRQSNDMQAARKVFIEGWPELDAQTDIGIKLMGKLDEKPFLNVCKKKYSAHKATAKAATLCSRWQEKLKDSAWHPFKREGTGDKAKEVVDEEDEQLKKLKGEWGEEVHKAVKTVLEEMNEYNASGIRELWNFKEERKATLQEVIEFISNNIK